MAKGLCPPPAPPFLLAAGANPRKWPCSQHPFSTQKMRVCVLLRCCFCCDLVPAARAVKEPARRRRHSSCYVLVSTLSAPFASFVAVPVAADAPAPAPAHCLYWWCCCGLCFAQLLYLLLLQLKLLVMQQRFLQGGCLSSSLACLLCKCSCCCSAAAAAAAASSHSKSAQTTKNK